MKTTVRIAVDLKALDSGHSLLFALVSFPRGFQCLLLYCLDECVLLLALKSQGHKFKQKRIQSERNSSQPGGFGSVDVFFSVLWFCFLEASSEFFCNG